MYTTLAPCYVCLKLLATARITEIYYEYQYESKHPGRDAHWQAAIHEAGIKLTQLSISPKALELIQQNLSSTTSARKLEATK